MNRLLPQEAPPSTLDSRMEAAIDWMVLLTSGHAHENQKADFDAWLQNDPRNHEAWQRIEKLLARPVEQLRQASTRTPVNTALVQQVIGQPLVTRRKLLRSGVAFTAVVSTGALWLAAHEHADYCTEMGERQRHRLEDGSWLNINACTRIQHQAAKCARSLRLLHGQILLDVAPQTAPFLLKTPHGFIEAEGQVMLWQDRKRSMVTALSASVSVIHEQGEKTLLQPGDAVWIEKLGLRRHYDTAPFSSTAWVDGMLEVSDASLGDVIAVLKPYLPGYVRVSPAAADVRVFGVFQLDQPELLTTLADVLPIRVARLGPWVASVDVA